MAVFEEEMPKRIFRRNWNEEAK